MAKKVTIQGSFLADIEEGGRTNIELLPNVVAQSSTAPDATKQKQAWKSYKCRALKTFRAQAAKNGKSEEWVQEQLAAAKVQYRTTDLRRKAWARG